MFGARDGDGVFTVFLICFVQGWTAKIVFYVPVLQTSSDS